MSSPTLSLGTCCGSNPQRDLVPFLAANKGRALIRIDTAYDYDDQRVKQEVDLVLLHYPCCRPEESYAQWQGLMKAKELGLTRSIGVSNFNGAELAELKGDTPTVNQCAMSVRHHDDTTIAYCHRHGSLYQAYGVMKGCSFADSAVAPRPPTTRSLPRRCASSGHFSAASRWRWASVRSTTRRTTPSTSA